MTNFRHYVTFCRRQQHDTRCLFFNDLPGLTHDAPAEVGWREVPIMCYDYNLTPRLALYESLGAAEEVVRNLRPSADRIQNWSMVEDSTKTKMIRRMEEMGISVM